MRTFTITAKTDENSHVICQKGVFTHIPERVSFIFTDENVWNLYWDKISEAFPNVPVYAMPAGEENKTNATLFQLLERMAKAELHRGDTLMCIGGGVVGDVGGLASALYMRGIPCIQVPTTLLAQVDSSVGGKTAIDYCGVKNLVGVFHQPKKVYVDCSFLETLPEREIRCGLGEIIKHGALSAPLFDKLIGNSARLDDMDFLEEIVPENIAVKADVVQRDAHESGLRKCLNLGHTTAHAFELCDGTLSHGEYVLWGILCEAEMAKRYCKADGGYLKELQGLVRCVLKELPALPPAEEAAPYARLDKKNSATDAVAITVPVRKGEYEILTLPYENYLNALKAIQETLC